MAATFPVPRHGELMLPIAAPVVRAQPAEPYRSRPLAVLLIGIGAVLTVGAVAGGLFGKVAAGAAMLAQFQPHMQADQLADYHDDIRLLGDGAAGLAKLVADEHLDAGQFPLATAFGQSGTAIAGRATELLARIETGVPDYERLAGVGGFDRVPMLIFAVGVAAVAAGIGVLMAGRGVRLWTVGAAILAGLGLAVFPFAGGLAASADSGDRMLTAMQPIVTESQVRQLQDDFVVVVGAVGEIDTDFPVAMTAAGSEQVAALHARWPRVSSDLANLVGTVNDNIENFRALRSMNEATRFLGVSGFRALPWFLLGVGLLIVVSSILARPRVRKQVS